MSLASKITLYSACAFTASIIGFVHFKQFSDRDKLHDGVVKDVERQQRRKIENLYVLEQQAELTKRLREMERQSSGELQTQNE